MSDLSQQDIEQVQTLLSRPLDFPPEFKSWLTDYIATNIPQLPINQALGGRGVPRYIDVTSATASVGATTAETTLFTAKVPAKRIAQNGQLRVKMAFTAMCSDVSNDVTAYLKLNGTLVGTSTTLNTNDHLDGNNRPGSLEFIVYNAGAYSQQYCGGKGGFSSQSGGIALGAAGTASVDTSQEVTVTVTAQFSGAGSQLFKLYFASVEIFNPIGIE